MKGFEYKHILNERTHTHTYIHSIVILYFSMRWQLMVMMVTMVHACAVVCVYSWNTFASKWLWVCERAYTHTRLRDSYVWMLFNPVCSKKEQRPMSVYPKITSSHTHTHKYICINVQLHAVCVPLTLAQFFFLVSFQSTMSCDVFGYAFQNEFTHKELDAIDARNIRNETLCLCVCVYLCFWFWFCFCFYRYWCWCLMMMRCVFVSNFHRYSHFVAFC